MKKNWKKKSFLNTREKVPSKLHYCKGILSIYLKEGTNEDKRKLLLICPSGIYGVIFFHFHPKGLFSISLFHSI
uniref:Uncharacterized protein n=1 Tax=Oryza rufipogon TaxID=4529 RepID=U5Q1X6_ORYRU|nr:hypothetical protein OrniCp036 [Oryza sativa f. spontanea]AGY48958.1 hypothetical protein [Oryza rufipogon]BAD26790.1 unnamed protein product [Oryza sativa f. spontanea]